MKKKEFWKRQRYGTCNFELKAGEVLVLNGAVYTVYDAKKKKEH